MVVILIRPKLFAKLHVFKNADDLLDLQDNYGISPIKFRLLLLKYQNIK